MQKKNLFAAEKKKCNLDCPEGFQNCWHHKDMPLETFSTRHIEENLVMIFDTISFQWKFRLYRGVKQRLVILVCQRGHPYLLKALAYAEMTGSFEGTTLQSIIPSGQRTCFMANNVILSDHPACSPSLKSIEIFVGGSKVMSIKLASIPNSA